METHLYGKVPVRMVCEPRTMSPKRYFKMVKSAGTSKDATLCLPSMISSVRSAKKEPKKACRCMQIKPVVIRFARKKVKVVKTTHLSIWKCTAI